VAACSRRRLLAKQTAAVAACSRRGFLAKLLPKRTEAAEQALLAKLLPKRIAAACPLARHVGEAALEADLFLVSVSGRDMPFGL
jgi:hypothetical protein